ncbi:MAG: ATP-binding cassette domain-containing protein [Spirochaetes bacterium]|nr:ATP-binding cassette domain-containing protein [Spirochaetota bacterium]
MDTGSEYILKLENITFDMSLFMSLKGISFSVPRGDNIVIFGMENSGIDILCPVISGIEKNYKGNVIYNDENISVTDPVKINRIRRNLAYMQLGYGLIKNMSVEENIALPLRYHTKMTMPEIEARVDGLIEEMGLEYCRMLRPVNLRRSELLKTSFARSVVLNPDLLLVEHPLEGQCIMNVLSFIDKLVERGKSTRLSTLIVTYDPSRFIDTSDRFIMLDSGKIVFDGNRNELLSGDNYMVRQLLNTEKEGPLQII